LLQVIKELIYARNYTDPYACDDTGDGDYIDNSNCANASYFSIASVDSDATDKGI
jgi:hypothetical protein